MAISALEQKMEQICTDLSCPNRLKPFNIFPWNGNDVLKWPLSLSLWVVWCDNYALLDGPKAPPERWKNEISKPCSCRHIRVILQIHQWSRLKNSPCLRLDYFTHTLHTHTHTLSLSLSPPPPPTSTKEVLWDKTTCDRTLISEDGTFKYLIGRPDLFHW